MLCRLHVVFVVFVAWSCRSICPDNKKIQKELVFFYYIRSDKFELFSTFRASCFSFFTTLFSIAENLSASSITLNTLRFTLFFNAAKLSSKSSFNSIGSISLRIATATRNKNTFPDTKNTVQTWAVKSTGNVYPKAVVNHA
jgi:hypothetical protein